MLFQWVPLAHNDTLCSGIMPCLLLHGFIPQEFLNKFIQNQVLFDKCRVPMVILDLNYCISLNIHTEGPTYINEQSPT